MEIRVLLSSLVTALAVTSWACSGRPPALPGNVVAVTAGSYFFRLPDTIPAGLTTFRMRTVGADPHVLLVVRLEGGRSLDDFLNAMRGGPPPPWAVPLGGPVYAGAGRESNTTMILESGTYALLCYFHAADGRSHLQKGMVRELKVIPAAMPPAAEPEPDIVVRLVDYDFAFSRPLTRGRHTIRFDNAGRQPHEVIVERLAAGRTLAEAMAADSSTPGPSPTEPFGGIGLLPPGGHVTQSADFDAGTYLLTCWLDDAKDGKSHREHGMVKAITVE